MENSLQVFISFNENITRRQLENYYYYSWKKKIPTLLKNFTFIIVFLIIIDSIFNGQNNRVDFFKFIGIILIIIALIYFISYYFNKANYISRLNKHIEDLKKYSPVTELYFDESSFYIKNEQYDIRSFWKNVSYEVSKETIYITIQIGSPFTFVVNKDETDQYENILNFLKSKSIAKKSRVI